MKELFEKSGLTHSIVVIAKKNISSKFSPLSKSFNYNAGHKKSFRDEPLATFQ